MLNIITRIKNAINKANLPSATYPYEQFFVIEFSRLEGGIKLTKRQKDVLCY